MSGGLFGVGSGEIILIVLIILLVMGPDRLPQLVRVWGKAMKLVSRFSNTWNQMNAQLIRQVDEETRPLKDAMRLDRDKQPVSPPPAAPPDGETVANTIAPPEYLAQSDSTPTPSPAPEAEAVPAAIHDGAETLNG